MDAPGYANSASPQPNTTPDTTPDTTLNTKQDKTLDTRSGQAPQGIPDQSPGDVPGPPVESAAESTPESTIERTIEQPRPTPPTAAALGISDTRARPFPMRERAAGSALPSRRAALLAGALAGLTVLAWLVVKREGLLDVAGPREIVRAQLDDLGRGQLRAAYELFSPRFREEVPFSEWRELVVTHWRVFRTRELRFGENQESGGRTVMETHLTAQSGDHYVARFTLIRQDGRWWVDDLRWSREADTRGRIST